jgi:formylglycine-generating enzyme required for sulfatase activity
MVEIDWVEIPAGEFLMGLSKEQVAHFRARMAQDKQGPIERWIRRQLKKRWGIEDRSLLPDSWLRHEIPQRVVHLDTFYIARFAITDEQASLFATSPLVKQAGLEEEFAFWKGFRVECRKLPVSSDWQMAELFCQKIGGRLPNATEWEKAARGTDGRLYPWGDEWDPTHCNCERNVNTPGHVNGTWMTPVDNFPGGVSPYGVWDMVGNVGEITTNAPELTGVDWDGPIIRAWPVKFDSPQPWFDHRVTRMTPLPYDEVNGFYMGFRPVLDEWPQQAWPGFRAGED